MLRLLELEDRGDCAVGSLNGTNSVDIVPAPAVGYTRHVRAIRFVNKDTAAVDIRVRVTVAGPTHYEIDNALALVVDGKFFPVADGAGELRLTVDEKITAVMGGAAATTDPPFYACWVDVPIAT